MKLRFLEDVTVATAGTRVRISELDLSVKAIIIQSDAGNTVDTTVYIGDSTVTGTKGLSLAPGESLVFSVKSLGSNNDTLNLKDFWADASVDAQKIKVAYTTRFGA